MRLTIHCAKKKAEYFVKLIEKNLLFSYDFY